MKLLKNGESQPCGIGWIWNCEMDLGSWHVNPLVSLTLTRKVQTKVGKVINTSSGLNISIFLFWGFVETYNEDLNNIENIENKRAAQKTEC